MLGNGVVLIGPGSEWFWAAISGLVTAVTLVALYRQLRLQRSQNASEQLQSFSHEWGSERMLRCRLAALQAIRDGEAPFKVVLGQATAAASFWENLGSLVRARHISPRLLVDGALNECSDYWLFLGPFVRSIRSEYAYPTAYENFEWLAGIVESLTRQAGNATPAEIGLERLLPYHIALYEDLIRVEVATRTAPGATASKREAMTKRNRSEVD